MHSIHGKAAASILLACAASLLLPSDAHAAARKNDPRIPTTAELRLLPPYCPHTQIISTHYGRRQSATKHDATTQRFVDVYGPDFWHLHHYCFGLVAALRAGNQLKPSGRESQLLESISQYDYVIRNLGARSLILPELHMQKGISLLKLKRGEEAVQQLKRAIQLNPKFAQPYIELSTYYADTGNRELAVRTLEEGLSAAPSAVTLQKRYAELGGTKRFSEPGSGQDAATGQETARPEEHTPESAPSRVGDQIGTPGNPYCRFCP